MESLVAWVKQIIIIVMFSVFIDFFIPSGSFSRYVKVVIGMLIVLALLNPVIMFLDRNMIYDQNYFNVKSFLDRRDAADLYQLSKSEEAKRNVVKNYKNELESIIEYQIKKLTDYEVDRITVEVEDKENKNFGEIKTINLEIKNKGKIAEQKIKKVSVDLSKNNESEESDESIKNLIEVLSNIYNIPKENINIELEGS
ncbi:MAG: stage III sporulation protein AF [Thermovenabulum sp.]|uniref:stage III sporulation protein AF n=1 Tax=Thermovenabulum sp. TaxID=3100335 RepID=UPI003C7B5BD2